MEASLFHAFLFGKNTVFILVDVCNKSHLSSHI